MANPAFGALYGGYKYESPESRALGSITPTSYDYEDQGKLLGKLVNDTSYMAAYMRKMQKGIDEANQNVIQQIQSLIEEIITLFGGGGDTGFDFGDLRYILQALGALFGLQPGLPLPVDLFEIAWHFFFNYIVPVEDFDQLINEIIDAAIATVLDLFGEVPIVGQALEQFAVIVSTLRDTVGPFIAAMQGLFDAIGNPDLTGWNNFWNSFAPVWDVINTVFGPFIGPGVDQVMATLGVLLTWSSVFMDQIANVVNAFTNVLENLDLGTASITEIGSFFGAIWGLLGNLNFLSPTFNPTDGWSTIISTLFNPVSLTNADVITELLDGLDPVSLTDTGVIGEILGGLTGTQWFTDLVGSLGALGLGTGIVTFASSIPVLKPLIDALVTAWGGIGTNFGISDLAAYAQDIGNQFVQGLLGGATVGDTIQNQADAIVQGIYQDLSLSGSSFGTVTGALSTFASYLGFNLFGTPPDNSVAGQGIINNLYISKQAIYKPISIAIDQSTDAPYNITDIVTVANANGGTLPTPIVMNAGDQPVGCFIPTIHAGNKRSIKWMGYASGPIDVFYANVYKFDRTTGTSQLVYASPNFGPYLSASTVPIWYAFNISDSALVGTAQEDIYYITLKQWNGQATPSTFTLVGLDHYIDNQPSSVPATFGATGGYLYPTLNAAKGADPPALSYNVNKAISLGANDNAVVAMAVVYSTTTSMTGITATLATTSGTVPMTLAYLSPNISSNGDRLYIAMFTHKGTAGVAPYTGVNRQINVVATGCTGGAIAISAASYSGVSAFGAPQTNSGISAAAAITVAGVTSGINVVGFASDNGNFTVIGEQPLVSFNGQTRMYPNALADGWGFNGNQVFSTTLDASSHWYAVAIPVLSSLGLQDISLDADPWYADSTPWIGFGCELGASGDPVAPEPVYAPVVIPVYSSQVWENPSLIWPYFNFFDFIVAGAGAGGDAGGFFQGAWGGACGGWAGTTIPAASMGTSDITWNIGAPGPGGSSVGAGGGSGGGSSVTIPAVGTLAAPGGSGRGSSLLTSGNLAGRGQDNPGYSFDGDDFPGAAGGNAGQGAGNQPGSGGGGGNAFNTYGQNVLGGPGGPGIGWLVGYQ